MIPDEPTDENMRPVIDHLILCSWPEYSPPGVVIGARSDLRYGIRWDYIFDFDFLSKDPAVRDALPVPIL